MFQEKHRAGIVERSSSEKIAQLLDLYQSFSKGRPLPLPELFETAALERFGEDMMVLRQDGDDFVYDHYGATIAASSGFDMTGKRVSDFKGEVGLFFAECYREVVADRRPMFTLHRATYALDVHMWERLILPVQGERGGLKLVVLNKVREFKKDFLTVLLDGLDHGVLGLRFVRSSEGVIADAVIVAANKKSAAFAGRSLGDVEGKSLHEVVPYFASRDMLARFASVANSRHNDRFEMQAPCRNTVMTLEVKVSPLGDGVLLAFADVTRQRRTEQGLRQRIADLEAALAESRSKASAARHAA